MRRAHASMRFRSTARLIRNGLRKPSIGGWCCKTISIPWSLPPAAPRWKWGCAEFFRLSVEGHIFLILATAFCPRPRCIMSRLCLICFAGARTNEQCLSLDQGSPHPGGNLLDGWDALSAASLCVSCRSAAGLSASADFRRDGTQAHAGNHAARLARDLGNRPYPCDRGRFSASGLVPCKICSCDWSQRVAWIFRKGSEGFGGRDKPA